MYNSTSHVRHLLDRPIEGLTIRAVPDFFALSNNSSKYQGPLLRVCPHLILLEVLDSVILVHHHSAAALYIGNKKDITKTFPYFAYALEDVDGLLEVAHMEDREAQGRCSRNGLDSSPKSLDRSRKSFPYR